MVSFYLHMPTRLLYHYEIFTSGLTGGENKILFLKS